MCCVLKCVCVPCDGTQTVDRLQTLVLDTASGRVNDGPEGVLPCVVEGEQVDVILRVADSRLSVGVKRGAGPEVKHPSSWPLSGSFYVLVAPGATGTRNAGATLVQSW
jgi:hypothetical protein